MRGRRSDGTCRVIQNTCPKLIDKTQKATGIEKPHVKAGLKTIGVKSFQTENTVQVSIDNRGTVTGENRVKKMAIFMHEKSERSAN